MKKLLSILTSMSIIASGSSTVMAMSPNTKINDLKSFDETNQKSKNELKTIDVVRHADMYIVEISMFSARINNFQDLTHVNARSVDPEVVKATIADNWIKIWAYKEGNTAVVVTADDAEDAIITVNVERMKEIEINKTADAYLNKTTSLQIKNAWELKDLSVESKNQEIATASIVNNMVKITGINKGTVELIVWALNGIDVKITVNVKETKWIEIPESANVHLEGWTSLVIRNFQDLIHIKAKSSDPKIVVLVIVDNLVQIYGVKEGITTIKVTADNAIDAFVTIVVKEEKVINAEIKTFD